MCLYVATIETYLDRFPQDEGDVFFPHSPAACDHRANEIHGRSTFEKL
jgi:hypothetical protein